jgi:flavin-dependent dehydrogenase
MTTVIKNIVIVGGGTAGWITAGTLAAKLKQKVNSGYTITLVESPNVPAIGVGEGTWPTMRNTLKNMGISETDFIKQCNVSFKQGAKFAKWVTGKNDDFYYHPLVLPQGHDEIDLTPHWLASKTNHSYAQAVCPQQAICELGLAPKQITTPEYAAQANYAYHLDAKLFSEFLKNHCIAKLDVNHIIDDVTHINSTENGDIGSVATKSNGLISGDLFIDCTGFNSLLLGQHFKVPFISCEDTLFIDQAIAVQVPYEHEDSPIQSHTLSTAQSAGWIWDIGLPSRRGIGSVYSSNHITEDQAHQELLNYLKPMVSEPEKLTFRNIAIKAGHRARFWEKNCVAIGLSAGFLEPLEASALLLIEISAQMIANQMPANRVTMDIVSKRYNKTFTYRWQRIIDFLKLHYALSKRTDNQFWIDNRNPNTISERLQEQLSLWKHQFPCDNDFEQSLEIFPAASYQYILYGMGFKTAPNHLGMSEQSIKQAQQQFLKNSQHSKELTSSLISNRELINKIKKYGLQKV